MRILNTGFVGINTNAPTALLSVKSSASEAVIGLEKVANGTFDTDLSSWTTTTWSHGTARANYTGTTGAIETVTNGGIFMNHGGTGYTVADVLTLTNGANNATITVSSVSSGRITAFTLSNAGTACTVNASVAVTGGAGSGATFNIARLVEAANTLSQNVTVVNDAMYAITYTVTRSAGELKVTLGGVAGHRVIAAGTYTQNILATGTGNLIFTPTADFTGSIDAVSVKLITRTNALIEIESANGAPANEFRSGGTGLLNTIMGLEAGQAMTTGSTSNTFNGYRTGRSNTTGQSGTFIGAKAGQANTTGANNTFLGVNSGLLNTTGGSNLFVGFNAGQANTTPSNNSFVGPLAGFSNTTGTNNTFLGFSTGYYNTTGNNGTFVGRDAGQSNTTGTNNTFVGVNSGLSNTTGGNNTSVGRDAGYSNTTGASNTFLGQNSGYANTTGSNNTFIGLGSGRYITGGATANTTPNNGIYLGFDVRASADNNTNETVIGYQATGNGSNTVTLGNTSVLRTFLTGLNLKAGSATAGTAPIKMLSGTLLTTPEAGAVEFNNDSYFGTITTGAARRTFAFLESPTFTGTVTAPIITATTANRLKNYTVSTLPAGVEGYLCYVTDALTPTWNATVVGGGAVKIPVFFDGTSWKVR
jgi:hypothetical protein